KKRGKDMAKRVLSIVETAYRATLEEQDDPVLWLTAALRSAGAETSVLLRGNAVHYAVRGQEASGLAFGERRQTQQPRIERDLEKLLARGTPVLVVADDLGERGVEPGELIDGIEAVSRSALPVLLDRYDCVWQW